MDQLIPVRDHNGLITATVTTPRPNCPYALMLHGGPGGTRDGPNGLFSDLSSLLLKRGWGTVRFTFRDADSSEALSLCSLRTDYELVHGWMTAHLSPPSVLIGESLGATVAIMSMAVSTERAVFLWPAINLCDTSFRPLFDQAQLEHADVHGSASIGDTTFSKRFIDDCLTLNLQFKVSKLQSDYCIIHGTSDAEVPPSHSKRLAEVLGDRATLHLVDDVDHGATQEPGRSEVLSIVTDWVSSGVPTH